MIVISYKQLRDRLFQPKQARGVSWLRALLSHRFWHQIGGHLRLIECNSHGIVWGVGYDHTAWAFTGGYGGGFFSGREHFFLLFVLVHAWWAFLLLCQGAAYYPCALPIPLLSNKADASNYFVQGNFFALDSNCLDTL